MRDTCSSSQKGTNPDPSWIWPPRWSHLHDLKALDLCRGSEFAVHFSFVGFESRTSVCPHDTDTCSLVPQVGPVTSLLSAGLPAGTGLSHFPGMTGETSHFAWEIFTKVNCPSVKICLASTGPCLCPREWKYDWSQYFSVWKNIETEITSSLDLCFQSSSDNLRPCFINLSLRIIFFGCEKHFTAIKSFLFFPLTSLPFPNILKYIYCMDSTDTAVQSSSN